MQGSISLFIIKLIISLFFLLISFIPGFSKDLLLVLNRDEASLSIIDPKDMKTLSKVPTGNFPHEIVTSADGKIAYVANYGAQVPGNSLSVIDLESRKELKRVDLGPLMRPHGLVELGGKLYFTVEVNRAIARYDPISNKVDWIMGTGQNASHMLVMTPDQKRIYTTNVGSDTVTAFEFNAVPPAQQSKVTQISVGQQPEAIDISPDGKELWVGLNKEGAIDIIDTAANKLKEKIKIGERPYRVKFTPDGKYVVATMPNTKEIIMLEAATRKEIKRLKFDSSPVGIIFSKDGKFAYVTTMQADAVLKIDIGKWEIAGKAETGKSPDGIALSESLK